MTRALGPCLLVLLATAGCGRDVALPDQLDGTTVGALAERELEAQNPGMATGELDCPDLRFEVGSSVRCRRTTHLSGGRVVKVRGTVEVTSLASGGRLHVAMDEDAEEFGLSGEYLSMQVRRRYVARFATTPIRLECPYLRGQVGVQVICGVRVPGGRHDVDVTVTAVDADSYGTTYRIKVHRTRS